MPITSVGDGKLSSKCHNAGGFNHPNKYWHRVIINPFFQWLRTNGLISSDFFVIKCKTSLNEKKTSWSNELPIFSKSWLVLVSRIFYWLFKVRKRNFLTSIRVNMKKERLLSLWIQFGFAFCSCFPNLCLKLRWKKRTKLKGAKGGPF